MIWGKKPEVPESAAEKTVAARDVSKWGLSPAVKSPETSAWDKLELKVLSSAEVENMLSTRFGKVRSALGVGTLIQGKLSFDTPVRIDGKLSGEVFSSEALIVGPSGLVDAQLEVASLVVLGTLKGKVKATQQIEVYSGGKLEAEVITSSLKVEEGAHFSGKCSMPENSKGRGAADLRAGKVDAKNAPGAKAGLVDEVQLH